MREGSFVKAAEENSGASARTFDGGNARDVYRGTVPARHAYVLS